MNKIKFVFLVAILTIFSKANAGDGNFNLSVSTDGKIILQNAQLINSDGSGNTIADPAKECVFSNTVASYGIYALTVNYLNAVSKKKGSITIHLFLKAGNTKLIFQGGDGRYTITGASAVAQKNFEALIARDQVWLQKQMKSESLLRQYQQSGNSAAAAKMKDSVSKSETERRKVYESYIRQNPNDDLSLYAMGMYAAINMENPLQVKSVLSALAKEFQTTEEMQKIKTDAEYNEKFMVGVKAPDFTQADTNGVAVTLSSLQGKYVLVDFWASWCKPCRAQNPSMVRLYKKYSNKGFTILGVSLDAKKDSWLTAIHSDKLEWQQVSDLQFWSNAVAKQYKITHVPQNYLLNSKGVIVGKNLSEDELDEVLEKELTLSK